MTVALLLFVIEFAFILTEEIKITLKEIKITTRKNKIKHEQILRKKQSKQR